MGGLYLFFVHHVIVRGVYYVSANMDLGIENFLDFSLSSNISSVLCTLRLDLEEVTNQTYIKVSTNGDDVVMMM